MSESQQLSGGELNAEITREVVRVHTASLGRGPKKAFTFYNGVLVVTVLEDVMTHAERSLASNGDGDAVLEMRHLYQMAMAEELKSCVARLTGREVTAFMSDNHLKPDMAVEVFVLAEPVD